MILPDLRLLVGAGVAGSGLGRALHSRPALPPLLDVNGVPYSAPVHLPQG